MIRVAISGAGGKLASPIAAAVIEAEDLELAALYNPNRPGVELHGMTVTGSGDEIEADVMVETAHPDVVFDNLAVWRARGIATVVGTSGFTPERLDRLREVWGEEGPPVLVVWLAVCYGAAAVGAQFMPGAWYEALTKPPWTPPGWLFAPVWTVLYTLMAVAAQDQPVPWAGGRRWTCASTR